MAPAKLVPPDLSALRVREPSADSNGSFVSDDEPDPFDAPPGAFDFGLWCPVCDRAIDVRKLESANAAEGEGSPGQTPSEGTGRKLKASAGKDKRPAMARSQSSTGGLKKPAKGSSTNLVHHGKKKGAAARAVHHAHHGHGHGHHGHRKHHSTAALHGVVQHAVAEASDAHHHDAAHTNKKKGLNTSTSSVGSASPALHSPTLSPGVPGTPKEPTPAVGENGMMYCSEECLRVDEARNEAIARRLSQDAIEKEATISPSEAARRRSSGGFSGGASTSLAGAALSESHRNSSSASLASSGKGSARGAGAPTPAIETVEDLGFVFKTRRTSSSNLTRLSSGYFASHRPSITDEELMGMEGDAALRTSPSLHPARQPGALSSFRLMTPISPPPTMTSFPSSTGIAASQQPQPLRRPSVSRSHTEGFKVPTLQAAPSSQLKLSSAPLRSETSQPIKVAPSIGSNRSTSAGSDEWSASSRPLMRKHKNSASSASLALLGSSIGKSVERGGWAGPKRNESTTSLSSMNAIGRMVPTSEASPIAGETSPVSNPPPRPSQSVAAKERRRSSSSMQHSSGSPSSHSSVSAYSSYAQSHSSTRSTAGSSHHGDWKHHSHGPMKNLSSSSLAGGGALSSSSGSTNETPHASMRTQGRRKNGLLMTPSASSLSQIGSTTSLVSSDKTSPDLAEANDSTITFVAKNSWTSERTPTQSLSRSTGFKAAAAAAMTPTVSLKDLKEDQEGEEEDTLRTLRKAKRESGGSDRPTSPSSFRPQHERQLSSGAMQRTQSSTASEAGVRREGGKQVPAATLLNPSLAYLQHEQGETSSGGPPHVKRNWSWDHLPAYVPTYPALDVDKIRREKQQQAPGPSNVATRPPATATSTSSQAAPPQLPRLPTVPGRERKKLFYFSEDG